MPSDCWCKCFGCADKEHCQDGDDCLEESPTAPREGEAKPE